MQSKSQLPSSRDREQKGLDKTSSFCYNQIGWKVAIKLRLCKSGVKLESTRFVI
nr:MAG TPA: hypothetical protein [Caudoviricetes sp.]